VSDFIVGLLSGCGATVIGFGLTALWESYRHRRDGLRRGRALIRALVTEVVLNKEAVADTRELLERELELLNQGKLLLEKLPGLEAGALDVLLAHQPGSVSVEDLASLGPAHQLPRGLMV
jgi:hypothetical protein